MKKTIIYFLVFLFPVNSCIKIEDEPFVTLTPTVEFQGYILKDKAVVNTTVYAGPVFGNPGNIPTVFMYEGEVSFYNEDTGELIASAQITGDGLAAIIETEVTADTYENVIIEASGIITAYADKESDGDRANDIVLHKSVFYEVADLPDVVNLENYPVVTMDPSVEFQTYFRDHQLYITSTASANPTYQVTASFPILFTFNGVLQVYDRDSELLIKSGTLDEEGLTSAVTVVADTTSYSGFVIIATGTVECTGDIAADGDSSNDIRISNAEFIETIVIDFDE